MGDEGPIYLFHHLPKAGGTSCLSAFERWFELVRDYRHRQRKAYPEPTDPASLTPGHLLCGHWEYPGNFLWERYPWALRRPDVRLITFVREPLELVVSTYYYGRRRKGIHMDKTLDDRVDEVTDFQARILGATAEDGPRVLDRYWFVGVTERLQESFDALAGLLGKPRVEVARDNSSERDAQGVSAEARARFERRCALEYRIYQEACRRLDRAAVTSPSRARTPPRPARRPTAP